MADTLCWLRGHSWGFISFCVCMHMCGCIYVCRYICVCIDGEAREYQSGIGPRVGRGCQVSVLSTCAFEAGSLPKPGPLVFSARQEAGKPQSSSYLYFPGCLQRQCLIHECLDPSSDPHDLTAIEVSTQSLYVFETGFLQVKRARLVS